MDVYTGHASGGKKSFFHLFDVSIDNTKILYNVVAEKPLPQPDLWLSMAGGLLDSNKQPV